jgi:hypothetical protein
MMKFRVFNDLDLNLRCLGTIKEIECISDLVKELFTEADGDTYQGCMVYMDLAHLERPSELLDRTSAIVDSYCLVTREIL